MQSFSMADVEPRHAPINAALATLAEVKAPLYARQQQGVDATGIAEPERLLPVQPPEPKI